MAFGAGSEIAHRVVGGLMGGNNIIDKFIFEIIMKLILIFNYRKRTFISVRSPSSTIIAIINILLLR